MTSQFEDSAYARAALQRALGTQKTRRRWQQLAGIVLLLAGYACLAVPAETPYEWLMLRVVCGFGLLFAGFVVAIEPTVTALIGDDG